MSPVDSSAAAEAPLPPEGATADGAAAAAAAPADALSKPSMQPRVYQLELLELAKNRNVRDWQATEFAKPSRTDNGGGVRAPLVTSPNAFMLVAHPAPCCKPFPPQVIAFLDTGAGKTFVSVLLIRHRMREQRRLAAAAAAAAAAEAASEAAAAGKDGSAGTAAASASPAAPDTAGAEAPPGREPVLGRSKPAAESAPADDAGMGEAPDVMPVHDPAGGHSHRVAVFLAPKVRRGKLDS